METINFEERLKQHTGDWARVVPFTPPDKLLQLDFTENNKELTEDILTDTEKFSAYINTKLEGYNYGIGGYNEHRTVYSRSAIFGPSPTKSPEAQGAATAPSRWEGEDKSDSLAEEETIGYRYADPTLYPLLKEYSIQHRFTPTRAESVLWEKLKSKQLSAYKFRRHHIIDRFIADFVCLKKKLVIEIDGLIHQLPDNQVSDEQRTKRLNDLGFQVIRFSNEEVINNLNHVLFRILLALEQTEITKENTDLSSPTGGQGAEARRLHLGVDIWGPANTPVYAPLEGTVHSFAFNDAYGDYGATLILQHDLDGLVFHTLYGHLSLASIQDKQEGQSIAKGQWIAAFGEPTENGQWPPHLHFQLIIDMQGMKGDYPGVCRFSERESYLANCPDANLLLGMMQYAARK